MKVILLNEAIAEFSEAVAYHEELLEGLGQRFRDEANAFIQWIEQHPEKPRLRPAGFRRANLKTFPY